MKSNIFKCFEKLGRGLFERLFFCLRMGNADQGIMGLKRLTEEIRELSILNKGVI